MGYALQLISASPLQNVIYLFSSPERTDFPSFSFFFSIRPSLESRNINGILLLPKGGGLYRGL